MSVPAHVVVSVRAHNPAVKSQPVSVPPLPVQVAESALRVEQSSVMAVQVPFASEELKKWWTIGPKAAVALKPRSKPS